MNHLLQGANSTAQWYQDSYPGAEFFSRLDKFCLHTTETTGWPGYDGGAKAPNATYHPALRQVRQHFYSDRSSRALVDPTDTPVRENRDNIFQLEIVAYSDFSAKPSTGIWIGDLTPEHYSDIAKMLRELHIDLDLPLQESVEWHEGRKTPFDDVRLTSSQFDAYKGILGHCHVSGNVHWDPGGFYISRLMDTLEGDVPLTEQDVNLIWNEEIKRDTDDVLRPARTLLSNAHKAAADGRDTSAANATAIASLDEQLKAVKAAVDAIQPGVIDYEVLAGLVVQKLSENLELGFRPSTPPVV